MRHGGAIDAIPITDQVARSLIPREAPRGRLPGWKESAMPQDTTNLIDMLLLMFAAMIAGLFIAGTLRAWQSWSEHRRIEKHLGRR